MAETLQADLASFIGKSCEFDYQVMTQGDDNNYCDEDSAGALIWASAVVLRPAGAVAQQDWREYGGQEGTRYSTLAQINR